MLFSGQCHGWGHSRVWQVWAQLLVGDTGPGQCLSLCSPLQGQQHCSAAGRGYCGNVLAPGLSSWRSAAELLKNSFLPLFCQESTSLSQLRINGTVWWVCLGERERKAFQAFLWLMAYLSFNKWHSSRADLQRRVLSRFVLGNFTASSKGLMISAGLLCTGLCMWIFMKLSKIDHWAPRKTRHHPESPIPTGTVPVSESKFIPWHDQGALCNFPEIYPCIVGFCQVLEGKALAEWQPCCYKQKLVTALAVAWHGSQINAHCSLRCWEHTQYTHYRHQKSIPRRQKLVSLHLELNKKLRSAVAVPSFPWLSGSYTNIAKIRFL